MRNKLIDITWKFANKLRDKYPVQRIITALISSIYLMWEARNRASLKDDLVYLINNAQEVLEKELDASQLEVFRNAIGLLEQEVSGLFIGDFFRHLMEANNTELQQLLDFLIKKTDEIDNNLNDFTNKKIASVFADIIGEGSYQKILDPCIGSGQLLVELAKNDTFKPEKVKIEGVEINPRVSLIAHINLTIHGFKNFNITTENILAHNFDHVHYDLVVGDLPLGFRLSDRSFGGEDYPSSWRFYHLIFEKCINQLVNFGDAYFTSTASVIRGLNKYANTNQTELEIANSQKNYPLNLNEIIDASEVASWSYTGIPLYIVGFKKMNIESLKIRRIEEGREDKSTSISKTQWYKYQHINDPSFFLTDTYQKISSKTESKKSIGENTINGPRFMLRSVGLEKKDKVPFKPLKAYFRKSSSSGKAGSKNDENRNLLSISSEAYQSIKGWKEIKEKHLISYDSTTEKAKRKKLAAPWSWIFKPSRNGINILIANVETPILIPSSWGAVKPLKDLSELNKEWLIAQILSDFVSDQLKAIGGDLVRTIATNTILENVLIPNQSDEEKEKFLEHWQEERIESLETEQEKIKENFQDVVREKEEERLSEEFDLLHELHHSLKNDINAIKGAIGSIENYLKRKENLGTKVHLEEPVEEQRQGADPKLNDSVNERLDMINNVTQGMSNLLDKYKEILKFDPKRQEKKWIVLKDFFEKHGNGYEKFNFEVREKIELNKKELDQKHYELHADPEVLRLVFQNIVTNAIDHGFTEESRKYSMIIEIKESAGEKMKFSLPDGDKVEFEDFILNIVIKNDGDPILSEINESDYFKREFSKSNIGSGLGGFHIKRGIEVMGGGVELLRPEEDDPYQTQIHIQFSAKKGSAGFKLPREEIKSL